MPRPEPPRTLLSFPHPAEPRRNLRAFRTPEWKLVRDFRNLGQDELYHLAADPGELENLIGSADPAVQEQLRALEKSLRESMKAIGDPAEQPMDR